MFLNEYIYDVTHEEQVAVSQLGRMVEKTFLDGLQPSPIILLVLASYKALNEYDWCNLLVVTEEIQEVFTRQVEEPDEEEKLKKDLPLLEEITDSVSSEVKEQYEENPYPRWVNLSLGLKPFSISEVVNEIKLKLFDDEIVKVKTPEILLRAVAQASIRLALQQGLSSNVLAIDLSLSSLAYAKRKTKNLILIT